MIEVTPESFEILSKANAPIDDYKRVSVRTNEFKSKDIPARLKHLFSR
jgi:hypothetical protein